MDINTWRGISTILVAIAFVGVCWWAFSPKRKKQFEDAANLPFADEELTSNAADEDNKSQTPQKEKATNKTRSKEEKG